MNSLMRMTAVALIAAAAAPAAAHADGFDVRPVTIETRDGIGLVVVANPGDRRIYLESQVFDWSQDGAGTEHKVESAVALASPPAMWVPPHSSYTLRVRLPPGPSPSIERAYRVIIRQLPERSDIAGGRIVFALTQNLPAFVLPTDPAPPALSAQVEGANRLLVRNAGGRRVRITRVSQDGQTLGDGLLGYALAQGALDITLSRRVHSGPVDLETDLGHQTLIAR